MSCISRALLVAILLWGCQGPAAQDRSSATPSAAPAGQTLPARRPNVVVIVVDDLRWDEFGAAGHPYLETPHIDRLAAEGALFVNSFHAVPLCSPNRASILTGQYPSRHGIIDNVARNLASHRLSTFPMAMREHGYDAAFLGSGTWGTIRRLVPDSITGWGYPDKDARRIPSCSRMAVFMLSAAT